MFACRIDERGFAARVVWATAVFGERDRVRGEAREARPGQRLARPAVRAGPAAYAATASGVPLVRRDTFDKS